MERRICINPENAGDKYSPEFLHAVETASLTRSLLYRPHAHWESENVSPSLRFRLLRVYSSVNEFHRNSTGSNNAIFGQANMRYLFLVLGYWDAAAAQRLLSLCSLLWNLQTLKVDNLFSLEPKIWEMPLLRHVKLFDCVLPDPPNGEHNYVLENLQSLSRIMNLKFSEEVVKRIPNLKTLKVVYDVIAVDEGLPDFCLNNLGRLQKLESLSLEVSFSDYHEAKKVRRNLVSFPHSLKKLCLSRTRVSWEELTIRIGSLPLLQRLILSLDACVGLKWETIEGQFCSLRVLKIEYCEDLKYWETDSAHFPCLEILGLYHLLKLEEIPSSIGDIPTLKSIRLEFCYTAADSAKRIKEEQEENGNEDLQVEIENFGRRRR